MSNEKLISDVVAIANTTELVKNTIAKLGLTYIAPLSESIQDEKISKAIIRKVRKGAAQ